MLAVPLLIDIERGEAKVGTEVDYTNPPLTQRPDRWRCGSMWVSDHGGIDPIQPIQAQLLDRQRNSVARVELIEAPSDLRAPGDGHQLEARVAPQQVRGPGAREARRAGHDHARRARREHL